MKREISVIDLGTNTIRVALAKCEKLKTSNDIKVLGLGYKMAKGLTYGTLTNIEELESVLLGAISNAEKEAQKHIKNVIIALPNWAVESSLVDKSISLGNNPIDKNQIDRLINSNNAYNYNEESSIIQVFPISYTVDNSEGIQDPIGLLGSKLSAVFNVITVKNILINNIKNCFNQCGIVIDKFICSSYAASLAIASDEELQSGVMIIDMGGSSTTISCIANKVLLYMGIIPIGGSHITRDISVVLRTNTTNAERLKILYGVSSNNNTLTHEEEKILVSSIDEFGEEHIQNVSKSTLDLIISSRLDEIFDLIKEHIVENNIDEKYYTNIIITGGGSRISCLNEYIKTKNLFLGSSVRLGKPIGVIGSNDYVTTASFSSTAGAILYGLNNCQYEKKIKQGNNNTLLQRIISKFRKGI